MAGGFGDRAKPKQVAIIRHQEDGKNIIIPVNTREIFAWAVDADKQKDKAKQETVINKNIQLEDRDIVYVPQLNNPKWNDVISTGTFLYYIKLLFPNWK
jgi:protein involved in polysaccharide export with SLBB domain